MTSAYTNKDSFLGVHTNPPRQRIPNNSASQAFFKKRRVSHLADSVNVCVNAWQNRTSMSAVSLDLVFV